MRIAFIAPSGYGKDTAVDLLSKHYQLENVKIAKPLYELQNQFYSFIDKKMTGEQDGELLQFYGQKVRKEKSSFLLDTFKNSVSMIDDSVSIICNNDCRVPDYVCLKEIGFIFVKINGFARSRVDHTLSDKNNSLEWKNEFLFDYEVDNKGSLLEFESNLLNIMERIIIDGKMLCSSYTKKL